MFFLTAVETAVARLSERNRRGDIVLKEKREEPLQLLFQFSRTFITNLLANFSLTGILVAIFASVGHENAVDYLKGMIWGSPATLGLLILGVLTLALSAGFFKYLLFWKVRGDENWRARWLGLVGGVFWLWILSANLMLPSLAKSF